jgi:hypothetical protein
MERALLVETEATADSEMLRRIGARVAGLLRRSDKVGDKVKDKVVGKVRLKNPLRI